MFSFVVKVSLYYKDVESTHFVVGFWQENVYESTRYSH